MADRIIKPDSGNDVVIQNDNASAKIEINDNGTIVHTGTSSIDVSGGTFITSSAQKQAIISGGGSSEVKGLVPVGAIFSMAFNPDSTWLSTNEYLICDGSPVSRSTYSALFSLISTTWGVGDGSTTFNLPDLRGEFLRGLDGGRGVDSSRTFASFQEGSHHLINTGLQIFGIDSGGQRGDVPVTSSVSVRYNSAASAASLSNTDARFGMARPRNIAVQYIIKF